MLSTARSLGLIINTTKTEVLLQSPRQEPLTDPALTLSGDSLKAVKSFIYLGSTITSDNSLDQEVEKRVSAASAAYGKLQTRVEEYGWPATKCKVYRAVVLTSLLYSAETFTLYHRHIRRLQRVQMSQLRQWN